MNPQIEKKFFDRFKFFRPDRSPQEGLMCFGFECDDGWEKLIWDLCLKIEEELKSVDQSNAGAPFEVMQVKEKFGTLRFYCNWATDKIEDAIRVAERASASICESCGAPGTMRPGGWILTLCDPCADKKRGLAT